MRRILFALALGLLAAPAIAADNCKSKSSYTITGTAKCRYGSDSTKPDVSKKVFLSASPSLFYDESTHEYVHDARLKALVGPYTMAVKVEDSLLHVMLDFQSAAEALKANVILSSAEELKDFGVGVGDNGYFDPEPAHNAKARDECEIKALENARGVAEKLAAAVGVRLGEIEYSNDFDSIFGIELEASVRYATRPLQGEDDDALEN